jgi:hypothetical protein
VLSTTYLLSRYCFKVFLYRALQPHQQWMEQVAKLQKSKVNVEGASVSLSHRHGKANIRACAGTLLVKVMCACQSISIPSHTTPETQLRNLRLLQLEISG